MKKINFKSSPFPPPPPPPPKKNSSLQKYQYNHWLLVSLIRKKLISVQTFFILLFIKHNCQLLYPEVRFVSVNFRNMSPIISYTQSLDALDYNLLCFLIYLSPFSTLVFDHLIFFIKSVFQTTSRQEGSNDCYICIHKTCLHVNCWLSWFFCFRIFKKNMMF